jgi:uncharacterized protein (UPF0332 family)
MSEVDKEFELAEEALNDLEHMKKASLRRKYNTLYFACYHATRAALISHDYAPQTHSGLDSLVHNILLKDKEILTEEEASTFTKLKTRREQADYETGFYGSKEELEELKPKAEKLIDKLKRKNE